MKSITLKEFAELAKNDEALKEKLINSVKPGGGGTQELIDLAADYGYKLTEEGTSSMLEGEELSDGELKKIAGGKIPKLINKVWFCKEIFDYFGFDSSTCSD